MKTLIIFFSSIRWQDIVDVSLNSFILFRLYILFRGTTAFRVLIGIAFLWFFQRIVVSMGLIITSWAIQGITAVAALIIVVVFRNEIRSVLQVKNLKSILWTVSPKAENTPLETIAESVYELAQKHIGALIVLPGREDLKEAVHSGIPWRGLVSREMILSVFWHDNPVHDGAAIIRGDRIAEVGVILPLSHRKDVPSHYGTRHRAALGMAEATDALVIVVSEERANVLVAKDSRVNVISRKERLVQILREHVGSTVKDRRPQKKEKLEIGAAALISFIFIAGIWFSISRGLETLVTLEAPIEYMNRDPKMEILDASVHSVNLNLSGSGSLLKSISPGNVKVRLDLSKAVKGTNSFTVTYENITVPPGVFLKKVTPSTIEVTLDVPIKKKLPIRVDWVGKLSSRLMLTEVLVDPKTVEVIGGDRILNRISTIYTEKVPLDMIKKSGTTTVGLVLSPASLKIAPGSKDKVTITYVVKER